MNVEFVKVLPRTLEADDPSLSTQQVRHKQWQCELSLQSPASVLTVKLGEQRKDSIWIADCRSAERGLRKSMLGVWLCQRSLV